MTDQPNPIADLMPTDPLMAAPWLGCLQFTLGQPEAVAAFQEATGNRWTPPRSPLERMIDTATGADLEWLRAFIAWHNLNVWGDLDLVAGSTEEPEAR